MDLVRHGATAGNGQKRYLGGSTDEPLSASGIAALRALPADRAVALVYASPLQRAVETARILFPEAEIVRVRALREMEFGSFERKNADELCGDGAYRSWVDGGCEGRCPGGESRGEFVDRCVRAFLACMAKEEERGADRAVFAVHGGTIMAILSELADPAIPYFEASVPPGGRWECDWDGKRLVGAHRAAEGAAPCSR